MKKFITYKESLDILNTINIERKTTQKLYLMESLNKVLAKDIKADHNSPAYETSSMDGYAFKFEDIDQKQLTIIDKNPAGDVVETQVLQNTCIKTFTGSLMPKGSDTLIPIENVTVKGDTIIINEPVPKGFAVRAIGENYKKDETLIKANTKIDFSHIGVMASLNIVHVEVYQEPVVAIASTGNEILDLGETQTNAAQIRSSNHLTLEALAKQHGAKVLQMGIVKDDKISICNLLKESLMYSDIVVTTGGVSVGDYDFVKDIIKNELGATLLFQGVRIKPGQHLLIAQKGNKFIVGLPGFAYSSTVCFILYVLPLLFKMKNSNESLKIVEAIIDQDFPKKGDKTNFSACNVSYKDGNYHVNFAGKKAGTSAILTNMLGNVGLLIQEQNDQDLKSGDKVKVMLL